MQDKQLVMIRPELWKAISERAQAESVTTETWLASKLAEPTGGPARQADHLDEAMLDLTLKHFRDLDLDANEQREVASAIFTTFERGEPTSVGPVGRLRRRYRCQRRANALRIQVGEGAVVLPLAHALRLATVLHGADRLHPGRDIAA